MRNFSTFIFSLIGGAAIVSAGTSEVTTLTKKTFTEFINENELFLLYVNLPDICTYKLLILIVLM
ncbi:BgTH12-06019 [Blumeria graminis f. sp. triticale]|uniref:Bgt-1295 n=3 Tax=Blumeria graminis TaxID=34373 RepID=A0A381LBA6_BLUGR|nr:disulfide isomerase [Blumeria graminis f. sp. tritici 96224]CAD6504286.1 BgTH12-06019 [Blumeria graminis f. sp. triticale]VDB91093.1 Bgt-1295 [Blumeria graminis f. sp. tritici]